MTGALAGPDLSAAAWGVIVAAYLLGGFVKGAVGFALPLIAVTLSAFVLPAQAAVAGVILPAFITNILQATRHGLGPMAEALKRHWLLNLLVVVALALSAGLLPHLDDRTFFGILGGFVGLVSIIQLAGWRPSVRPSFARPVEAASGVVAGFFGGITGSWGPPIVLYLAAIGTPKREQVLATGVAFALGAATLAPAHLVSGVLNGATIWISLAAIAPALAGQALGQAVQDRLDQDAFRRIVLIVLSLSALNLLRRAVFG